jgi:uncharacterized cofD-like protein
MSTLEMNAEPTVKTVVIGGGTGNSTVLKGLKHIVREGLTAMPSTFDDGGGTGNLRDEYEDHDLVAVGDGRQCLDAMSFASDRLRAGLNKRLEGGRNIGKVTLQGQTVGNLNLAGFYQEFGDISEALEVAGEMYQIKGRVMPPTHDVRRLVFNLPNGKEIYGEHEAEETKIASFKGAHIGFDKGEAKLSEEAEQALHEADFVVVAPGDLYTSVGPVLAVGGMKEALKARPTIMVANLMNRKYHTRGFTALDYAQEYERILGNEGGDPIIDRVIYNTETLDPEALAEQIQKGSRPVRPNVKGLRNYGFNPVGADLISPLTPNIDPNDAIGDTRSLIRHDPNRVAHAIMGIWYKNGFANTYHEGAL